MEELRTLFAAAPADAPALVFRGAPPPWAGGAARLTFGALRSIADRLAGQILSKGGRRRAVAFAVSTADGDAAAHVVAQLACLAAGTVWCPTDDVAATRLAMRPACEVSVADGAFVVARADGGAAPDGGASPDGAPMTLSAGVADGAPTTWPDDALYGLSTSGTGPGGRKAVVGSAAATAHRLRWERRAFAGGPAVLRTPPVFVDAIHEVLAPLLNGDALLVPRRRVRREHQIFRPKDTTTRAGEPATRNPGSRRRRAQVPRDAGDLVACARDLGAARITLTPSLFAALLRAAAPRALPALRRWTVSGEALPRALVDRFEEGRAPDQSLVNVWGCTETAADATFCVAAGAGAAPRAPDVPVGTPLTDEVAVDVENGELVVSGAALALGYAVNGALAPPGADDDAPGPRFVAGRGGRRFRTGDARGRNQTSWYLRFLCAQRGADVLLNVSAKFRVRTD